MFDVHPTVGGAVQSLTKALQCPEAARGSCLDECRGRGPFEAWPAITRYSIAVANRSDEQPINVNLLLAVGGGNELGYGHFAVHRSVSFIRSESKPLLMKKSDRNQKKIQEGPSIDPAVRYADDVVNGRLPAGEHVANACRRFFRDLDAQDEKPWSYSLATADRAVRFFEEVLTLSDGSLEGRPFTLLPWQQFLVRNIYGWLNDKDNMRRFRKAYIETGKGSGKSPLVAGMGIRSICGDDENRAQGYVIAKNADQAMVTFEPAVSMVESSPLLDSRLKVLGGEHPYRIVDHTTRSFLSRVTSNDKGKGKSGPIPHMIIVDEYHEHETAAMRDMYAAGVKNRRQPLTIMITNSGVSMQSPCGQEHMYACAVASGEIEDDAYFSLVFSVGEDDDPMNDEGCWIKANPSLALTPEDEEHSVSIPGYDYIRGQVREAQGMPSKRSVVERLNFCRWVDAEAPWIDRDKWEKCEVSDDLMSSIEKRQSARSIWIAMDLSQKVDLTAATIVFDFGDYIEAETIVWTPKDTIVQRSDRDSVPYVQWAEQGHIIATPGSVVDMETVAKWIGEQNKTYPLSGLVYDPWRIDLLQKELDLQGILTDRRPGRGLLLVPHPQGFVAGSKPADDEIDEDLRGFKLWMPKSIEFSEEAILNEAVRVKINPALRMAIIGMVVVADAANNRRPTKTKSLLRIDPAVSFVMGVGAACAARLQKNWKPIGDISDFYQPIVVK